MAQKKMFVFHKNPKEKETLKNERKIPKLINDWKIIIVGYEIVKVNTLKTPAWNAKKKCALDNTADVNVQ